jgi:hypothetical protein
VRNLNPTHRKKEINRKSLRWKEMRRKGNEWNKEGNKYTEI